MGEQVAARSNGDVAQLGEHLPCKQGVESSNLFISTEIERFQDGLIAQLVRGARLISVRSVVRVHLSPLAYKSLAVRLSE